MNKEAAATSRSSSPEQNLGDSMQAKKKPNLVERVKRMHDERAEKYQKFLEQNMDKGEAANDNERPLSPQEIILQQEATRRRRIEMLNEMASIDQELEMQNGLDAQSEVYITQQLQTVDQSKQELGRLEQQKATMQGSFFKRAIGRLFGGEKRLNTALNTARATYAERNGLLQGAQNEYFRHKTETVALTNRSEALHAEADQLDKEIAGFISFDEKEVAEIPKTREEAAREQLFAGMGAEELQEQQAALRSERNVLQASAKEFETSKKRLEAELQTVEQPLTSLQHQASQLGEFLKSLNMERENASARLADAQKQHEKLNASFWSRLVNKQEILTLEQRMNEERVLLQGLDHHFMDTQTKIAAIHQAPEVQISQKRQAELTSQLNKLTQKQELTRKRLLENDLLLTEVELASNRVRRDRPAPAFTQPIEAAPVQKTHSSIPRDELRVPRRSNTSSDDLRQAA